MQREVYAAEVERLRNVDLDAKVNERFESMKEQIANEVIAEHEKEIRKLKNKKADERFSKN